MRTLTNRTGLAAPAKDERRGDEDDINEGDDKTFVTVADMKRFRRRTLDDLNHIIGMEGFQKELIGMQSRLALVWNGVNAVLKAFLKKGLIAAEDVREAGAELAAEAKTQMASVRRAIAEKRQLNPDEKIPTPLETFREALQTKPSDGGEKGGA